MATLGCVLVCLQGSGGKIAESKKAAEATHCDYAVTDIRCRNT
jgi:hypothetical protein